MPIPPVLVLWLTWRLLMPALATPTEFEPYDGPLADRQVFNVDKNHGSRFEIDCDTPQLRRFERWLRNHPIYVRAPGEKYLVLGMKTMRQAPGMILVTRINLLLDPSEQPLGPWLGDGGAMLEWAFSVVDHYGLKTDPQNQYHHKTRQELIDWYRSDSVPVDWQAVADRLRATGRPVPADLFDRHP